MCSFTSDSHKEHQHRDRSRPDSRYRRTSLRGNPLLLIIDEALEKLASPDFDSILELILDRKKQGTSIILITHKLDDIYMFADRVSIIKNETARVHHHHSPRHGIRNYG